MRGGATCTRRPPGLVGCAGMWRRLVARPLWERKVVGSNPAIPTGCPAATTGAAPTLARGATAHWARAAPAHLGPRSSDGQRRGRARARSGREQPRGARWRLSPAPGRRRSRGRREGSGQRHHRRAAGSRCPARGDAAGRQRRHLGVAARVRRGAHRTGQQRRLRGLDGRHRTGLRQLGAQLDLSDVHVPGDADRGHRDRRRLTDPGHRRHGPRAGVRTDRGPRRRARAPSLPPAATGDRHARGWFRGRDRARRASRH